MTASSPVTMADLVAGLNFVMTDEVECRVELVGENYFIKDDYDKYNTVSISSDGLTITFGGDLTGGPTFASFTFNA